MPSRDIAAEIAAAKLRMAPHVVTPPAIDGAHDAETDATAAAERERTDAEVAQFVEEVAEDAREVAREAEQLAERAAIVAEPRLEPDPIRDAASPLPRELLLTRPAPRRWLLRHPSESGPGDGLLPLGRAGILSAAGGTGKTLALLQLGVSIITGKPWLGYFTIDPLAVGLPVLLGLAEEDREEVHRRLWAVAQALRLTEAECHLVEERLLVLPLVGRPVTLARTDGKGGLYETRALITLRNILGNREAWALVAIDPLSRWAGGGVEGDNDLATRFVQITESLCESPGRPTVLVSGHSSKTSRRAGEVDTRGVTGLADGYRWEATLREEDGAVWFKQSKSNYSMPMPDELKLFRQKGGVLRAATVREAQEREEKTAMAADDRLASHVDQVVEAVAKAGILTTMDAIAAAAHLRARDGRVAVALALSQGRLERAGSSRFPRYSVPNGAGG